MRRTLIWILTLLAASSAAAEVPPLQVSIGEMVEGIACASDPTQTYTLYTPSAFTSDRRWPVLLVFDPRGRSLLAAELFREAAETHGWIIVSSDVPRPTRQLAGNLHIRDLTRIARQPDEEGVAAQRCLNSLYSALSFYLPLDDLPEQRYSQVAASYELATMIRDDNVVVWYNLACVRALLGQKNDAVEALAKALELGFDNSELLKTDPDLDPLRSRDDFKVLLMSARSAVP
jgi:tetratricopeptide (TPR) repeat protein